MTRCPKCGYENPDGVMNCKKCRINLEFAIANFKTGKPTQVRRIFKDFSTNPNTQVIDQLNALIKDSDDPEVTTAILETFDFKTNNLGVFGLALQSLGLVRDPRALEYLIGRFDDLSRSSQSHPDPQVRSIFADHFVRIGVSIVNLVNNKRDLNPKAVPYLKKIWESGVFSYGLLQANALNALENFVGTYPEVKDYIKEQYKKLV